MFSSNTSQVSNDAVYVEDIFSTYLYTGNGSTQTITNGIDLAGNGGLVWIKNKGAVTDHLLLDSARGTNKLSSNTTASEGGGYDLSMLSTGFTINDNDTAWNASSNTYVSWTFREQAKFFDVVTYTGTGSARTVAHNLGSVPGCMIIKRLDVSDDWIVYHRSLTNANQVRLRLNDSGIVGSASSVWWNNTTPTSTVFTVGTDTGVNASGGTYVAYLFAHNAGGFGLTGTADVISCGSYTGNGSTQTITLNYEPQFLLIKKRNAVGDWKIFDNIRGIPVAGSTKYTLSPNLSAAEDSFSDAASATATGFQVNGGGVNDTSDIYIYIAIRRGPMKVPTSGTSVFAPITNSNTTGVVSTTNFPVDLQIRTLRSSATAKSWFDRLRGISSNTAESGSSLASTSTTAEVTATPVTLGWNNTGYQTTSGYSGSFAAYWNFRRAPSFFDEVCYTGTGANRTINHNLGVVPEMMIVKSRSTGGSWAVYHSALGNTGRLYLNTTAASVTATTTWNSTTPTSTVFSLGTDANVNDTFTYVWYGFATCAGVSKVGSYTGTGATQTISCGFTGGARFVLIKRTDAAGNWYVWDTARGMVTGADPRLALDSTVAEVNQDFVYTASGGFQIVTSNSNVNASGGTYIFLAIA